MKILIALMVTLCSCGLLACSGSQTAPTDVEATDEGDGSSRPDDGVDAGETNDTDGGAGDESESCEGYSLGDGCITEENLAQCREMAAQCPGQVQVMESCPLQFGCP